MCIHSCSLFPNTESGIRRVRTKCACDRYHYTFVFQIFVLSTPILIRFLHLIPTCICRHAHCHSPSPPIWLQFVITFVKSNIQVSKWTHWLLKEGNNLERSLYCACEGCYPQLSGGGSELIKKVPMMERLPRRFNIIEHRTIRMRS